MGRRCDPGLLRHVWVGEGLIIAPTPPRPPGLAALPSPIQGAMPPLLGPSPQPQPGPPWLPPCPPTPAAVVAGVVHSVVGGRVEHILDRRPQLGDHLCVHPELLVGKGMEAQRGRRDSTPSHPAGLAGGEHAARSRGTPHRPAASTHGLAIRLT